MRKKLNKGFLIAFLLLSACRGPNEEEHKIKSLSINKLSVEEPMLMFRPLKPGMSYSELKGILPPNTAMPLSNEIIGDSVLQESIISLPLLGRNGKLELNFKDKRLYSYYYFFNVKNPQEGDSLYAALRDFYNKLYNKGEEEQQTELSSPAKSAYWHAKDYDVALTFSEQSNEISWGIQEKRKDIETLL